MRQSPKGKNQVYREILGTWPSGKLPFECKKIAQNPLAIFLKKWKFLAIFWQSNSNFPEGQVPSTSLTYYLHEYSFMNMLHIVVLDTFFPMLMFYKCWIVEKDHEYLLMYENYELWKLKPNVKVIIYRPLFNSVFLTMHILFKCPQLPSIIIFSEYHYKRLTKLPIDF